MKKIPLTAVLIVLALAVLGGASLWAQPMFLQDKMVDLTHALEEGMPQFSDEMPFTRHKLTDYPRGGYLSFAFSAPEHIGTHIDAPNHFFRDRRAADEIPIRDFVGTAFVINVVEEARKNPDYRLYMQDLRAWELRHGPIRRDSIVILRTGWESRWFTPKEYLNRDKDGLMHFPGFSCEVVDYLAHNRSVRALGTDTLSVDAGNSADYCVHKILLQENKYAIEGLTNLEKLPPRGATVLVSPLKIKGGSGAPARVTAWVP